MGQFTIRGVAARQVFDSRATPTVEVDITLEGGAVGRGTVPSGASTGIFEALELRDGDPGYMRGKGVSKALAHIEKELAPALIGKEATDQVGLDAMMIALDGTPNKSRLGANAILGCSMAVAHAAAAASGVPLFRYLGGANAKMIPVPMIQIIGGGAHAQGSIDIQDFLVIPLTAKTFAQGFGMVVDVYKATRELIMKKGRPPATADEGGFWPIGFAKNEEGLELVTEGIRAAGYEPGKDLGIALDIAASEFFDKNRKVYTLHLEQREMDSAGLVDMLCGWVNKYPVVSIEDGCSELDWEGSTLLTRKLGGKVQIIGDDLFTTNIARIRDGVKRGACNSVLIKMNQIGTITETLDTIAVTQSNGYLPVVSARSGETEDATIVHLAIATNAGQLKVGSVAHSERAAKWNEAIRMEQLLGKSAVYPSGSVFDHIIER